MRSFIWLFLLAVPFLLAAPAAIKEASDIETTKELLDDDQEVSCCICLEELSPIESAVPVFECGHKEYHAACLSGWLHKSMTCPLCRDPIVMRLNKPLCRLTKTRMLHAIVEGDEKTLTHLILAYMPPVEYIDTLLMLALTNNRSASFLTLVKIRTQFAEFNPSNKYANPNLGRILKFLLSNETYRSDVQLIDRFLYIKNIPMEDIFDALGECIISQHYHLISPFIKYVVDHKNRLSANEISIYASPLVETLTKPEYDIQDLKYILAAFKCKLHYESLYLGWESAIEHLDFEKARLLTNSLGDCRITVANVDRAILRADFILDNVADQEDLKALLQSPFTEQVLLEVLVRLKLQSLKPDKGGHMILAIEEDSRVPILIEVLVARFGGTEKTRRDWLAARIKDLGTSNHCRKLLHRSKDLMFRLCKYAKSPSLPEWLH
jgi:hypothetical protein